MLKRSISLGELIAGCFVIIGWILGFWINTNIRLSALEINKEIQETNYIETKNSFKEIGQKLDKLGEVQNEIKVTLQNKEDRK